MFLDEAKIASGIEHVNVAQILDLGEQAGQLYLVMEWVDGDSLQELDRAAEKAGGWLPIPVLVRVMADVCAGLHAAHELADAQGRSLNVVHRDVSPQNILISSKGGVKVIDFGVVKARRRATEETSTGTIKGKLQYMAPEQALGQGVDRRADIFSVGATLYRLLARRPVYRGNSPLSTFKRLTSSMAPEPLPPHVPGVLSTLVLKALSFERERRFTTAAELGSALEALLQGPYQTSAREVTACVEQYLGPALSARRAAIGEALEASPGAEKRSSSALDWESGISQAKTLPGGSASESPSAPPTTVERIVRPLQYEEVTRSLQTPSVTADVSAAPSRRPAGASGRAKLVATGGMLALGGALAWGLTGAAHAPAPAALPALVSVTPSVHASPHSSVDAPLSLQALPMLGEAPAPAAAPPTVSTAEPAPISPEELSKSAVTKHKPATSGRAPLAVPHPVAAAHSVAVPHAAAASSPVVALKPKRKIVDDGF